MNKEGMINDKTAGGDGTGSRVRIVDIAEELGLSTATVSNVIHGKTKKISDETVKRVEELLEKRRYIPSMAGILLAQNDSRIIGVVVNDHEKYEGRVLEDGFISAALNALSREIDRAGYFMMVKTASETEPEVITKFASMWNMEGLVLIGFCEQDYKKLREEMHIPFVVYDGNFEKPGKLVNITIDNFDGGRQVGNYLKEMGHEKVLCISDNDICVDDARYEGLKSVYPDAVRMIVPMRKMERIKFYNAHFKELKQYTAVFCVSDYYAVDFMFYLQSRQIEIPGEISVVGFDDSRICEQVQPPLTTIRQDNGRRASEALRLLKELKMKDSDGKNLRLPVSLVERESVKNRKT